MTCETVSHGQRVMELIECFETKVSDVGVTSCNMYVCMYSFIYYCQYRSNITDN